MSAVYNWFWLCGFLQFYDTEFTLWDRFDVKGEMSLEQFLNHFKVCNIMVEIYLQCWILSWHVKMSCGEFVNVSEIVQRNSLVQWTSLASLLCRAHIQLEIDESRDIIIYSLMSFNKCSNGSEISPNFHLHHSLVRLELGLTRWFAKNVNKKKVLYQLELRPPHLAFSFARHI